MEWSPELSFTEHLLWCAFCARVTNASTLSNLQRMLAEIIGFHPAAVCNQAGDQNQGKLPGCCVCSQTTEVPSCYKKNSLFEP